MCAKLSIPDLRLGHYHGVLLLDDASRAAAADDFGHLVHRQPRAVLKPGSVNDVVELVRFARRNNIQVAARGQGHSTQGQAQVEAGVVVDMSTLATVHEINPTNALVDGGARWLDLLVQSIPQGLTPPTLVDFLELTVGGTLSLGGIGSQAFRFGAQVDNVIELQVRHDWQKTLSTFMGSLRERETPLRSGRDSYTGPGDLLKPAKRATALMLWAVAHFTGSFAF